MLIGRRKIDKHTCGEGKFPSAGRNANLIFIHRSMEFALSSGSTVTLEELSIHGAMYHLSTDLYIIKLVGN
jgi:hypothetical protein